MICIGEVTNESGIYQIKNLVNGKIYIGSSINLRKRKNQHNCNLKKTKHPNDYLQSSWNKYGSDNFSFSVIEIVNNEDDLIQREQYWINNYNSYDKNRGYNINPIAGSSLGVKRSDEQIESYMLSQKSIPFLQFDLEGNLIREWYSTGEMSRALNISKGLVNNSLKKKYKILKNYYLIYKDEFTEDLLMDYLNKQDGRNGRILTSRYKKVNQYNKEGIFVRTWESIKLAGKSLNIDTSHIASCCKGKVKSAGGFIWKHAN